MTKRIFTFWEDKDSIPDYIKLCWESWNKYLKDYEIVVLNYSNLENWIGKNYYDKILFEKFTLAQQAQAIRAAVLEKHGGIWLDADIIVTDSNIEKFFEQNSDLNIFGSRIACLCANKHSKILKKWIKGIKWNLFLYKHLFNFYFIHFPFKAADMMRWDYLSSRILNKLCRRQNKKNLNYISIIDSKTYLEFLWDRENGNKFGEAFPDQYNYFYIKNDFSEYVLKNNNGLIILHNSWMPREYKTMTKEQVLSKNNTLSEVFKKILN